MSRNSSRRSPSVDSDRSSLHGNDEAERALSAFPPVAIGTGGLPPSSGSGSTSLSRTPSTPVLTITPSLNVVNAIKNRADRKGAREVTDPTIYTRPETGEKVSTRERIVKGAPERPPVAEASTLTVSAPRSSFVCRKRCSCSCDQKADGRPVLDGQGGEAKRRVPENPFCPGRKARSLRVLKEMDHFLMLRAI